MFSEAHDVDVTLPLLPCPPLEEVEGGVPEACEMPPVEESKGALPSEEQILSASEKKKEVPPPQERPKQGVTHGVDQEPCGETGADVGEASIWEEREVPASEESFFFVVPPLLKPVRIHKDFPAF